MGIGITSSGLFIPLTPEEESRILETVASHGHSPDPAGVRDFLLASSKGKGPVGTSQVEEILDAIGATHPLAGIAANLLRARQ